MSFLSNEAMGLAVYSKTRGLKPRAVAKDWRKLSHAERLKYRPRIIVGCIKARQIICQSTSYYKGEESL